MRLTTINLLGLMQAMMWPMALLNMAEVIDNPWSVCTKRYVRNIGLRNFQN